MSVHTTLADGSCSVRQMQLYSEAAISIRKQPRNESKLAGIFSLFEWLFLESLAIRGSRPRPGDLDCAASLVQFHSRNFSWRSVVNLPVVALRSVR